MNKPTEKSKRIVSKAAFIANTGKKAALASYGTAVCLLGLGALVVTCVEAVPVTGIFMIMGCCLGLLCLGGKSMKEGKEIDAGVPLTRANTAHLSAADSLVRASSEPVQEQGAVLLRAAVQGSETPTRLSTRYASISSTG